MPHAALICPVRDLLESGLTYRFSAAARLLLCKNHWTAMNVVDPTWAQWSSLPRPLLARIRLLLRLCQLKSHRHQAFKYL